jgi:hypothetical protein
MLSSKPLEIKDEKSILKKSMYELLRVIPIEKLTV